MADNEDLMQSALRMIDELPDLINGIQERANEWAKQEFVGEADEGRIQVTVDAFGVIKSVQIDVRSKRSLDNITLGEMVTEAIKEAEAAANAGRFGMGDIMLGGQSLETLMKRGPL